MCQRQGDPFCGSEPILTVEDHAVAAIQQEDGRTRTLVLRLTDHQIFVFEIERSAEAFPRHGVEQRRTDIEVQCISELVFLRGLVCLHTGSKVDRLMPAEAAPTQSTQEMTEESKPEEVDRFIGQFESCAARWNLFSSFAGLVDRRRPWLLLGLNPALFDHPAHQLLDQFVELFRFTFTSIGQPCSRRLSGIRPISTSFSMIACRKASRS